MGKSKVFKPGQHLKVSNAVYSHHGIYVGRGKVVHYAGKSHGLFDDAGSHVQETTLKEFSGERTIICVPELDGKFCATEVVNRARSRVGENSYSLFSNNCEHFVNWCIHGEHSSAQIQRAGVLGGVATTGVVAARFYQASKMASTVVNTARIVAAATSSSGAGAVGSAAGSSTSASLIASCSTLLKTPAAPVAAAVLITGGLVYGVGKLSDWW